MGQLLLSYFSYYLIYLFKNQRKKHIPITPPLLNGAKKRSPTKQSRRTLCASLKKKKAHALKMFLKNFILK